MAHLAPVHILCLHQDLKKVQFIVNAMEGMQGDNPFEKHTALAADIIAAVRWIMERSRQEVCIATAFASALVHAPLVALSGKCRKTAHHEADRGDR